MREPRREVPSKSRDALATLNAGSSTIKIGFFSFEAPAATRHLGRATIDLGAEPLRLRIQQGPKTDEVTLAASITDDMHGVVDEALTRLKEQLLVGAIGAVGHRVVHGGARFRGPVRLTDDAVAAIEELVPLAPLHQPHNLRLIRAVRLLLPKTEQVASFDTAFHRTQQPLAGRFALPRALHDAGIRRYGFHGLSYKWIAGALHERAPDLAAGRVVVAHLGSGASLCALAGGLSQDTTMGFSTLDGLPMSTRCGSLDAGVILHLIQKLGMDIGAVEDLLYRQSGLLGVSGLSGDTRVLIESGAPEAREALDLFCFRVAREVAALATTLGGLDGLVFTAGIGEHQPSIRSAICDRLAWLGIALDPNANVTHLQCISTPESRVAVLVIPTDEEQVIADETVAVLDETREPA